MTLNRFVISILVGAFLALLVASAPHRRSWGRASLLSPGHLHEEIYRFDTREAFLHCLRALQAELADR